jgi:hypothetical protein
MPDLKLKRIRVDGRDASVAYLDNDFEPVEFENATIMKVFFDDGETLWAKPERFDGATIE